MSSRGLSSAPVLAQAFDPDDIDTFWVSWENRIGNQKITSSVWVLPDGWTAVHQRENYSFTDEFGMEYGKSNAVTLSTTHTDGLHHIVNRITTDQGNRLDRGFMLQVSGRI